MCACAQFRRASSETHWRGSHDTDTPGRVSARRPPRRRRPRLHPWCGWLIDVDSLELRPHLARARFHNASWWTFATRNLQNAVVVSPDAGGVARAKMFKEGLANDEDDLQLDEDDDFDLGDQAPMRSTGTGANFLRQLLGKAVYFDIEVGSFIYSHPYQHNDIYSVPLDQEEHAKKHNLLALIARPVFQLFQLLEEVAMRPLLKYMDHSLSISFQAFELPGQASIQSILIQFLISPPFESRRFMRYIRISLTMVADCVGQWQYLVVWRRIFSARVVIFEAFVD